MRAHYERLQGDVEKLVIRAPCDGILLAPLDRTVHSEESDQLPTWQGSPFAPRNRGAWLNSATAIAQVGEPAQLEAVLAVPQDQLEFVSLGSEIQVLMPHQQSAPLATQVKRIAGTRMEDVPEALDQRNGGPIVAEIDSNGRAKPQQAMYEVSCQLADEADRFAIGQVGQARIHAGERNMAQRLVRYAKQTFAFEL